MDLVVRASARITRTARIVLAVTIGLAATSAGLTSTAAAAPAAPASVTLVPAASDPHVVASWTPVTSADLYVIDVFVNGAKAKSAQCAASCTARSIRHLAPGQSVKVGVRARTAGVDGPTAWSGTVVVPNPCGSGTVQCIRIDATSDAGPVTHVGQGFLHANGPGLDQGRAAPLRPQSWRVRAAYGRYASFDTARALGAEILLLVSDAVPVPAKDPATTGTLAAAITTYRDAVRTYVQSLLAAGRIPEWWEIQNEPDLMGWSAASQLAHWKAGYEVITSLVPGAKVIGPAASRFMPTPATASSTGVDLQTFLAFAKQHGIRPAAIGWHENAVPNPVDFQMTPDIVRDHVAWARQLLAAAGMSDVPIRIDEYGGRVDGPIPGWQVGWLSALEASGVDAAEHSCFPFPNGAVTLDGCETANLNTLLVPEGQAPRANYWVALAYAGLAGRRLATSTSVDTISTVAAAAPSGAVSALVGRHVGCLRVANLLCPLDAPNPPGAVDVPVTVRVPSSTAALRIVAQRVPFSNAAVSGPTPVLDTVTAASGGAVTFTLPKVADGDALLLTLTPAGAPTQAPTTPPPPAPTATTTTTTTPPSTLSGIVSGLQGLLRPLGLF